MKTDKKARKHSSPVLEQLLAQVSPLQMEQTKQKMQTAAKMETIMKAKGLSKTRLARLTRKNPSIVTKWLSGTHNFTQDTLTEIALALQVEVSSLFEDAEVEKPYSQEHPKSLVATPSVIYITQGTQVGTYGYSTIIDAKSEAKSKLKKITYA